MSRVLLQLAILAASKATQAAYDHARALGNESAAIELRRAGSAISAALSIVVIRASRGSGTEETLS